MLDLILNIISLGLKPIYEKHLEYYTIIEDFRNKLPRRQNEARILTEEELSKHPALCSLNDFVILNLSTHKISISEPDIDQFYNRLDNFDYRFMLFKDYYKGYTSNLNRFNPKAKDKNFDLVMVQQILSTNSLKPIKPLDVLIYHLKWQIKFTSKVYVWFLKRSKEGKHL